jgi:hypothetical protein
MAATFDANLGNVAPATGATATLTTSSAAAAGSTVVIATGGSGTVTVTGIDVGGTAATFARGQTNTGRAELWFAYMPAGLASSSAIVVTFSASMTRPAVAAISFLGFTSAVAVNQTTSASQFNATAWSSGATATTTIADAAVVGLGWITGVGSTSTPEGTYTEAHDFQGGSGLATMTVIYKTVAATAAYTASGTWLAAAGADNVSLVAVFASPAVPPGPRPTFNPIPFMGR